MMMAIIVTASKYSPRSPDIKVAAISTSIMKSLNWFKKRSSGETLCISCSSFHPLCSCLRRASSSVSPCSRETPNRSRSSSPLRWCQFFCSILPIPLPYLMPFYRAKAFPPRVNVFRPVLNYHREGLKFLHEVWHHRESAVRAKALIRGRLHNYGT
ncbi:hypothetical protein D3C77_265780 [compost metagenome]